MHKNTFNLSFLLLFSLGTNAASITTKIYGTDDKHQEKGSMTFKNSPGGLLINSNLHDLPPGPHGLHIHQNKRCDKHGMSAGGHLDPNKTNLHLGPYGNGHLGDLPVLYVNAEGKSLSSMLAPKLKIDDIKKRSIMIHAGGDNYTDTPSMGGGGPRIACGVIP
jgi:superoxide dismutase, Cu-Zn family